MSLAAPKIDPSFEWGVAEFVQTGRTVLDFPHPPCIAMAVDGLKRLLTDPDRGAWTLNIPRPGEPNDGPDDGLVRKGKTHTYEATDNKWFFHFRPTLPALLAERGVSTMGHEELLAACGYLHRCYSALVFKLAAEFDRECPGYHLLERMQEDVARDTNVLRILAYDPGCAATNLNGIVARPHTDRDCITLHIAESRPGLRLGTMRAPYIVEPHKILAFAGQKLERLTKQRILALLHDVQDPIDVDTEGRWSMVFFSHIPNV